MTDIIDWPSCIKLANNNEALAKDLLRMLVEEFPITKTELRLAIAAENYGQIQHHAHRLHGAACYCGVPQLKVTAQKLEQYLKSTETPDKTTCEPLYNAVCEAITAVENAYQQLDSQ